MQTGINRTHLDRYLDCLRNQRRLSPHTVANYRRDVSELVAMAEAQLPPVTLTKLTHFHIRKFAASLHAKGLNARSIARKLSAWRSFFA